MVEVMTIMATSFKRSLSCTAAPSAPTLQQATTDPRHHRRLLDTHKSGSVSCGVTAPFSWVLVHTRFCLCPPRVCFQSCVSSGSSMVGLMVASSKRAYATQVCCTQSLCPLWQSTADLNLHRDTQTQFCLSLSGISGSWCAQAMFEPFECL